MWWIIYRYIEWLTDRLSPRLIWRGHKTVFC